MEIRPILSALLRSKTAPLLVAIQVALTLAGLVNALYIVDLRLAASARASGVADEASVFHITTSPVTKPSHEQAMAQRQRDLEVLRALPGVAAASWTNQMPVARSGTTSSYSIDRKQQRPSLLMGTYFAPPGLIDTLGLRLVEGRDFQPGDVLEIDESKDHPDGTFPTTAILSRRAAEALYPGTSALGKPVYLGTGASAPEMRVIGVVETLQTPFAQAGAEGEHSILIPLSVAGQYPRIAVRADRGQRDRAMADAEAALRKMSLAPRVVILRSTEQDRTGRYRNERTLAWMLVAVSGLLLLVTGSGIVGMTMLRISQRRKQIGVRRALGARRIDIVRHFVVENVLVSTAGIAFGLVLGLVLNRLLVTHLQLSPLPPYYLVGGALALWALGILAVSGPAWRAAGIPPATATRSV